MRVSELYKGIQAPVLVTDPASAEMIKYAANAFLATKVSFINAIANLCEALDADVREVAIGIGYDTRIGFQFLHPGPGYGGSCFPKDVSALLYAAREAGYDFELLAGVVDVNRAAARTHRRQDSQRGRRRPARRGGRGVGSHVQGRDGRPPRLSGVGRLRGRLLEAGAIVQAYDPAAGEKAAATLPGLDLRPDPYDAAAGADVIALLAEWDEFRWLEFERVATSMPHPAIVDARNLLDPHAMRRRGFRYDGVGRR